MPKQSSLQKLRETSWYREMFSKDWQKDWRVKEDPLIKAMRLKKAAERRNKVRNVAKYWRKHLELKRKKENEIIDPEISAPSS